MTKCYDILLYSGDALSPVYYLIDGIEGETAEIALEANLPDITQQVREMFDMGPEIEDRKIYEGLYLLENGAPISVRGIVEKGYPSSVMPRDNTKH